MNTEYEIKQKYEALAIELVRALGDEAFFSFEKLSEKGKKLVIENREKIAALDKKITAARNNQTN